MSTELQWMRFASLQGFDWGGRRPLTPVRLDRKQNAQGSHKISEESRAGREPPKLCVRPDKSLASIILNLRVEGQGLVEKKD